MYWLDYSAAKLSASTIKANGYGGVIRYIDNITDPTLVRAKHASKAEYDDHVRNGLTVLLVMEVSTGDADGGFSRGVDYAKRAKAGADYLGYTGPIFFCNDKPTVSNTATWRAYLDGAASVLGIGRVGAYGFFNAMDAAVGHASVFWQAGRRSDVRGHVHLWQDNNTQVTVGGISCDRNLVLKQIGTDMAGFDATDFTTLFYNNPIQKFGNVSQLLADIVANVEGVPAAVNAVKADVAAVKASVANLGTPAVDLDALAAKVAPLVAAQVGAAVAAAVADELNRRLAS